MGENLFSGSWYRVAELRPRLRRHARIHRHVYRGQAWYVLEDVANQRVHRFTPATHGVIGLMDGRRSVKELWEIATETLGDDAPTQDEMIRLLAQLHAADVLQSDVPPDTAELLERFEKRERQALRGRLLSPLAIKVPLIDPDRFLLRCVPMLRPFTGWLGAAIWLAVVVPALFLLGTRWSELTHGVLDRVLQPQALVLLWLLFPVIKTLHEFGHGLATRLFGGEVHDMGVMLLVFTPVPYVDASSASAFPEKHRRALVASGGMIVEIFLAALAFYLWRSVEPGVVRTLAYNTMLIAGVTTLTFNANPLLRFDGYYILSDLLEIPNLRQRANSYLGYLAERWLFGNPDAEPPDAGGRERLWLALFAVASFFYRFVVIAFILLFVFDLSLPLGTLMAVVSAIGWLVMPTWKTLRFLATSPRLALVRGRAFGILLGAVAAVVLLVVVAPLPFRTQAEGVVWAPDEAFVRAGAAGFVTRLAAQPGSRVRTGDLLVETRDPDLDALVAALQARLRGLAVREHAARLESAAQAEMIADEIHHYRQRLERAEERRGALQIRSGADGVFVVPGAEDVPGRYVEQGQLIGYVLDLDSVTVRAVVRQEDIELVRDRLEAVALRRADRMDEVLEGRLVRLVPAALPELPSVALGSEGGGEVAVDPRDSRGLAAVTPYFEVEIQAPKPPDLAAVGGRVYLRFDHGLEPLVGRWYRSLRQLFLSRLDV
jgi:putative peptide zinc metalloprotease protein